MTRMDGVPQGSGLELLELGLDEQIEVSPGIVLSLQASSDEPGRLGASLAILAAPDHRIVRAELSETIQQKMFADPPMPRRGGWLVIKRRLGQSLWLGRRLLVTVSFIRKDRIALRLLRVSADRESHSEPQKAAV